jgi:hypothetical protein
VPYFIGAMARAQCCQRIYKTQEQVLDFDYRTIKKDGIGNGQESYCTVIALDVVEFTKLGDGEAFSHAVHELEYILATVLRKISGTREGKTMAPF